MTAAVSSCQVERLGVWRRTVLVAGPSLLRPHHRHFRAHTYMKGKATEYHEAEPIGIVISRGLRTEPTPVILAFEWAPAPESAPASHDNKAA